MEVEQIDQVVSSLRASLAGGEADSSSLGVSTEALDAILAKYEEMRKTTTVVLTDGERAIERVAGLREAQAIVKRDRSQGHHTESERNIDRAVDSYNFDGLRNDAARRRSQADAAWADGQKERSQQLHAEAAVLENRVREALPYEAARPTVRR